MFRFEVALYFHYKYQMLQQQCREYVIIRTLMSDGFSKTYWYSQLALFRSPRNSLKYFEISVPRHIRFAELRKK